VEGGILGEENIFTWCKKLSHEMLRFIQIFWLIDDCSKVGKSGKRRAISSNTLDPLITDDPGFYAQVEHSWKTLMRSATLFSTTSAKERNHFFAALH